MTPQRISHLDRRYAASALGLVLMLTSACAAEEDQAPIEGEPDPAKVTELSRPLEPLRAVENDPDINSSFDDMLDVATENAVAGGGSGGTQCSFDHYVRDGFVVAVDEMCPGYYRRAMLFGEGPQGAESLQLVFGDFDVDGRIDGWFDPAMGLALEDVDRDGTVDRSRTTTGHIDPALVDGFADGWTPPAVIEEYVLEDTDHDGYYDRETLIAGYTPDGEPTYWVEE